MILREVTKQVREDGLIVPLHLTIFLRMVLRRLQHFTAEIVDKNVDRSTFAQYTDGEARRKYCTPDHTLEEIKYLKTHSRR